MKRKEESTALNLAMIQFEHTHRMNAEITELLPGEYIAYLEKRMTTIVREIGKPWSLLDARAWASAAELAVAPEFVFVLRTHRVG